MNSNRVVLRWHECRSIQVGIAILLWFAGSARAQECYSGSEIDAVTSQAVEAAARQYFEMSARGDVAGLKANAVPELAASFGSIERAVVANKEFLAQGQAKQTQLFVLDASNSKTTWQRAEFYCGIYNSPDRVGFAIPNLPPGRYAVTITKVTGKDPITLTTILADAGKNVWKLAGYYVRRNALGEHDGQWFLTKAREYKEKKQLLNAWFYYLTAWDLIAPVDFMSTPQLDKLTEEIQASHPVDMPVAGATLVLPGGKSVKLMEVAAIAVGTDFDLRVHYESADMTDPALASQENTAVMKALLAKYPELRDGFAALIARATDSGGHDYGTLMPMKDVK
jgi:hypothetical protein